MPEKKLGRAPCTAAERAFCVEIGVRIRDERKAASWTQTKLALHLGVHPSLITKIEQGRIGLSAYRIRQIAGILDISIRDLMSGAV